MAMTAKDKYFGYRWIILVAVFLVYTVALMGRLNVPL